MFRYRLFWADGGEVGEAEYAVRIKPDEIVWALGKLRFRVIEVVQADEEGSQYEGLLQVEAAG